MTGSPIRQQLEQYRTFAATALIDGPPAGCKDRQNIVAVHRLTAKAVGGSPVRYAGILHHEIHVGRRAIQVVLADEDDRQIPDGRHVDALVKRALGNRAITEEAGHYLVLFAHLERERHSRGERDSAGDDGDAGNHSFRHVADMHRAAAALAASRLGAKELIEELLCRQALRKRVTVAAKRRSDPVLRSKRGADPDRRGFLPLALVNGPGHRSFEEEEFHGLLEFAYEHHPLIQGKEKRAVLF